MIYNHKQPIPVACDVCGNRNIEYTDNKVIYGENRGRWHKCYYCPNCKAVVGCHPGTNIPKGLMATAAIRRYRVKAHKAFDPLWQDELCTREDAYIWMAELLGLPHELAHIGLLSREHLEFLIAACPNRYKVLERRKAKQHAKQHERHCREQQTANRGKR